MAACRVSHCLAWPGCPAPIGGCVLRPQFVMGDHLREYHEHIYPFRPNDPAGELQRSDPAGIQDQIHWANCFLTRYTSTYIGRLHNVPDKLQPLRAGARNRPHRSVNIGPAQRRPRQRGAHGSQVGDVQRVPKSSGSNSCFWGSDSCNGFVSSMAFSTMESGSINTPTASVQPVRTRCIVLDPTNSV